MFNGIIFNKGKVKKIKKKKGINQYLSNLKLNYLKRLACQFLVMVFV